MRKATIIFTIIVLILSALTATLSWYILDYAVHPTDNHTRDYDYWAERVYRKYPELEQWFDSLATHELMRDTFIVADDGLKRHALILQHDSLATGSTIMVHGYKDNCIDMMRYYYLHYEVLKRNVIVPEMLAHGLSQGEDVRFGWLDRLDFVQLWMPMAHSLWPEQNIVQHGLSMGAATTMMTSGEAIPDTLHVVGFIEDCGYTDTYTLFELQNAQQTNVPSFPMLNVADWLCGIIYGWRPSESSALKQVAKCKLPMLFIHGEDDQLIPVSMAKECFEAKTQGYRDLWIAPGTRHAATIHQYWEEYCQRVKAFIEACE